MTKKKSRLREPNVDLYFGSSVKDRRKTAQLCGQVMRALSFTLGDLGDESLSGVWVAEVEPCPDAGHLSVALVAPPGADLQRVREVVDLNEKRLRWDVANAIHRKKAPQLSYVVLPGDDEEVGS